MKKLVKVFGLLCFSSVLFSCSTEEQDADLERAIKLSQSIEQMQMREVDTNDSLTSEFKEDGTPIIVIKKD